MAFDKRTYFAAEQDSTIFAQRAMSRAKAFRDYLSGSGRTERMQRVWSGFYGAGVDGMKSLNRLLRGGEQGEVVLTAIPVLNTLIRQTLRLMTGSKPTFKAIAANTDANPLAQVALADSLIETYDRQLSLYEKELQTVLSGVMLGSGTTVLSWANNLGDVIGVDPESGAPKMQGDIQATYVVPWDAIWDYRLQDESERPWGLFKKRYSRFMLAAQYGKNPELKEKILTATNDDGDWVFSSRASPWGWADATNTSRDDDFEHDSLWVWEFRHKRTPALPQGRLVRFVNSKVILWDSMNSLMSDGSTGDTGYPYPDDSLLMNEYCPERVLGKSDGHSVAFDAVAMQEGHEMISTTVMTNANIGGLVNMWMPPGSPPEIERLSTGLNVIQSPVKPEVLQTMGITDALINVAQWIQSQMVQVFGQNDVSMGNVEKGTPGNLAALLEAKAIQYQQQGQAGYWRMSAKNRTDVIKLLQRFATTERTMALVGKANKWAIESFSKADISGIDLVTFEPVNPVMATYAGRESVASQLAERGWVTKDEYFTLMTTGKMESTFDAHKAWLGRIAAEKEMLAQGIGLPPVDMMQSQMAGYPVFVEDGKPHIRPIKDDKHWLDIPEYLSVIANPESRNNAAVVTAVLDVVEEKLRLWRLMDPDILLLLGGPQAPSVTAQQMMMGLPPGSMPGSMPPGASDGPPPGPTDPQAGLPPQAVNPDVKLPKPPANPLTGEQGDAPQVQPVV